MNVEFLMAVRNRLIYEGQTTLTGALLAKPDDDKLVKVVEYGAKILRGDETVTPIDAVELMVAEQVDGGEALPITNPEGYGAAQWLSQMSLSALPDPMPRAYVLYLAHAFFKAGKYPSFKGALQNILATRSFV